jgi:septum formation protein
MNNKLILASASARRKKILLDLGLSFDVLIPDVEEVLYDNDARRTALENAARKHEWCRSQHPDRYILAADTIIDFEGRCIGKAGSRKEALSFLKMFSGRTHIVYTGVAMSRPHSALEMAVVDSAVRFRNLTDEEVNDYFAKVNPMDRAGAYDIDELGESLIDSFTGSRTNIMGLPQELVSEWLTKEKLLAI